MKHKVFSSLIELRRRADHLTRVPSPFPNIATFEKIASERDHPSVVRSDNRNPRSGRILPAWARFTHLLCELGEPVLNRAATTAFALSTSLFECSSQHQERL